METQPISHIEDTCPKDIVQQLLDIAKSHDALDEIGGATSWRWQEGIISRMPKTKTVAKVLRKAYNSDDPYVWVDNVDGPLRSFILRTFKIKNQTYTKIEPKDIYEAAILLSLIDSRGFRFEEMITRLSFLKYAKNNDAEEYFVDTDYSLVCRLHEKWATKTLNSFLEKYNIPNIDGYFLIGDSVDYTSPEMFKYQSEITYLRNKVVEGNSHFDYFGTHTVALSDEEMIYFERKIISFQKELLEEFKKCSTNSKELEASKTRLFSFTAISMPSKVQEDLKWKR